MCARVFESLQFFEQNTSGCKSLQRNWHVAHGVVTGTMCAARLCGFAVLCAVCCWLAEWCAGWNELDTTKHTRIGLTQSLFQSVLLNPWHTPWPFWGNRTTDSKKAEVPVQKMRKRDENSHAEQRPPHLPPIQERFQGHTDPPHYP